jgi:hypothetical protein
VSDLTGTVVEHRINDVTSNSATERNYYKLKSTQMLNRNAHLYSQEQLAFITEELKDFLSFFGYVQNDADPENITPFFTADKTTQAEYKGFLAHNKRLLSSDLSGRSFTITGEIAFDMPAMTSVATKMTIVR